MDLQVSEDSAPADSEAQDSPGDGTGMHQVWTLALSLSVLQVGFGIVTPIFPYYITAMNMGGVELGVLAASFALTRILLAGPMGGLSDRAGRRPVLIFALLGFAISNVMYAFAADVVLMILARALEGAVSAGFFPAANAFVSDVTTPANRGTAMGYLSMGNMIGFVIGPTVGGVLAQYLGIRMPFIIAAGATILTMVLLHVFVKEPVRVNIADSSTSREKVPIREVLARAKVEYGALGVAMFANMFAIGILEVAFMLDAVVNIGIEPIQIGAFFGVIGVIMIIGNVGFGKLSDVQGRKWLIVVGAIVGALSMYMFMVARDVGTFLIAGAILAVGMSMRGPTIQAMIGDLTDPRAYGSVMGVFGAISNGAYVVSPLLSGYVYDETGSSSLSLLIAAFVSLAGGAVAAVALPDRTSPQVRSLESVSDIEEVSLDPSD
ncbi:MAG: MFS transporter [Candidatus Thorarchaeota archaeon]